jgi:hypothetical protein
MPLQVELEIDFGVGFVDVHSDVRVYPEVEWEQGIRGSGPLDRTATPGMLRFYLNNNITNSGGVVGYYSPGHPSVRSGFNINCICRLTIDGIVQFYGWITSITPTPGEHGHLDVEVIAMDYIGKLMNEPITGLPTMTSTTADLVITEILDAMDIQPTGRSLDTGSDTYPYALDTSREEESNALSEIAKVVQSEGGFAFVRRDGYFVFTNRTDRANPSPSVALTEDEIDAMEISYPDDAVRNRVRVKIYPRASDASNVVLYSQSTGVAPSLTAGGATVTIQAPYTDPNNRSSRVGGTSMVNPVSTTDFAVFATSSGGGTNLTANLTVTPLFGGDSAQLALSLGGGTNGFLTKLQVRGLGLYTYSAQTIEESDTGSIDTYGKKSLIVDMPYQSDLNVGVATAQSYLEAFKDPGPAALVVSFRAITSTLLEYALNSLGFSDVNSAITLQETVTGGSILTTYWINGIRNRIKNGTTIYATWYLGRADVTSYWVLDDAAYTLGDNTRLGAF